MAEVESSNPNTNTADIAPSIEKSGGDSGISSFDDLEAIDNYQARVQKLEKGEGKKDEKAEGKKAESKKSEPKKESKAKLDKSNDDADDADAGANDETTETAAKAEQAPAKVVKAKDGDKEVDLNLLVKVPVKIAGQDAEVTLEELRNNYAGKVVWEKRFSEVGRKEQRYEKVKADFVGAFKEFEAIAEKDGLAAMCKFAEMNGHDPVEFRKKFVDGLLPQLEKYAAMSDDERAAAEREFENQLLKSQLESHRRKTEEQSAISALQAKVDSLQQTHQIDAETFASTYQALEKLQAQGKIRDIITPEMVAEVAVSERRYTAIESALDELGLGSDAEAKERMTRDLMAIASTNPELTPGDLKEIAMNAWGTKKAQNLSRKIQKVQGSGRAPAKSALNPQSEPLNFDEL